MRRARKAPGSPGGRGWSPGYTGVSGGAGEVRPWDEDWALIIPDTVEPVTHLWAESGDQDAAEALADEYEALVRRAAELE